MNHSQSKAWTVALAAFAWGGVLLQGYLSLQLSMSKGSTPAAGLANFLSYFTVLTNLLVCVSLSAAAIAPASPVGRWSRAPTVMGGIAASIAFVCLSYHFLLRHTWNPQGAQRVADDMLHYATPVLYLVYWACFSPRIALPWARTLRWCAYPTLYLVYALIRGALIGVYPYPFIDVGALGCTRVSINAAALLLAFIILLLIVVAASRLRATSSAEESP